MNNSNYMRFGPTYMCVLAVFIIVFAAFLSHNKTCLLARQETMPSCVTRRHVFLCHKKTCVLVAQEDMFSAPKSRNPEIKKHCFLKICGRPIWDPKS